MIFFMYIMLDHKCQSEEAPSLIADMKVMQINALSHAISIFILSSFHFYQEVSEPFSSKCFMFIFRPMAFVLFGAYKTQKHSLFFYKDKELR